MKAKSEGKKSKEPIFERSSLPNSQPDASRLVGGIVEKGFSGQRLNSPSAAPRPSVLPFPVARHRSHGPLWAPVAGSGDGGNDGVLDVEGDKEDEQFTDFDQIMAFSRPVQRKKKKGLDFSRWQEVMAGGGNVVPKNKVDNNQVVNVKKQSKACEIVETSDGMGKPTVSAKVDAKFSRIPTGENMDVADEYPVAIEVSKEQEIHMDIERESSRINLSRNYEDHEFASPAEISGWSEGRTNGVAIETKEKDLMQTGWGSSDMDDAVHQISRNDLVSGFDSHKMVDEHGASGLENQIDAENRARLENMTAAEIAEAQSEIIAKLSPALVNALKKRGQDKLKGRKKLVSDAIVVSEVCQLNPDNNLVNVSVGDGSSNKKMKEDSTSTPRHQVHHSGSHSWSSWSARVEAVKQLRFSLDGNIIGSASAQNGYGMENVSERDFLRTEGDPGAIGYTIKEAVSLMRSVVPGQRALALHLIAAVLEKAMHGVLQHKVGCTLRLAEAGILADWEAIWAFALGPEPELALSLRICFDDTHDSVVLACAKAIQSVFSCGVNEVFFDISQKIPSIQDDIPTAGVFRAKPEIDVGFLGGGFWKYSAKPSNILPLAENMDGKPEAENTIQDDVVVGGQDVVAGLVRMGILTRIQYLLETEPSASLEECLLSVLIAVARHSQNCAAAIMMLDRLVQTIVNRFTMNEPTKIGPSKIKSVTLLKVLALMERKNCEEFVRNRTLHTVTWHLCRDISLEQWMKSGKEVCGLSSLLLVEQLRLWRVCIKYGYCVSYFADLFPFLRVWLYVPTFGKLVDDHILSEFAAISKEAYLVIEALAERLPNFYLPIQDSADATVAVREMWSWSYVGPLIDLALEWTAVKKIPHLSRYFDSQKAEERCSMLKDENVSSLLLVVSSAMHMLSAVLEVVVPIGAVDLNSRCLPWLPEFVPRIGLHLIKNGYFCFSGVDDSGKDGNFAGDSSFLEFMCYLRCNGGQEVSIASTSCLQGLVTVVGYIDKLIWLAKPEHNDLSSPCGHCSIENEVLSKGIIQSAVGELEHLLTTHMRSALDWHSAQSIEIFGRGGPAPGVGVGWGASGGGFWSSNLLLAQADARLITCLLGIVPQFTFKDPLTVEQARSCMKQLSAALEICVTAGPRERSLLDKLFDFIFQAPVLKCLEIGIHQFLHLNSGLETLGWKYEEDDYILYCSVLAPHFKRRWLSTKKSSKRKLESHPVTKNKSKGNASLDTIYEEMEPSSTGVEVKTSLAQEWAYQRLPLPSHWFLSPISVMYSFASSEANDEQEKANFVEVGQAGLFFLLGLEAMPALLALDLCYVVQNVPVVWKLHVMSVMLVDGMSVLESEKSRDTYGILQSIYGQLIDKSKVADVGGKVTADFLNFKSDVHESYCTFVEILVEQFAAVSYGDVLFGRQIAIYLTRCVETSVRLAAWNALSNSRTLELVPHLKECAAKADVYLEPIEDDERMLEAYAKSWVSGALDKAATRESMSYTLALHHLVCFIFGDCVDDKVSLRNQLVKSLLRDYSHKAHHEGMMMKLLEYKKPSTQYNVGVEDTFQQSRQLEDRIQVLREACEGSTSLVNEVEKLRCNCAKEWP